MNKIEKTLSALLLGVATLGVAGVASADPTKKDDNYGYIFEDEALFGGNMGATTAQIHVNPRKHRELLIRPRVHFVAEMLKSVENM